MMRILLLVLLSLSLMACSTRWLPSHGDETQSALSITDTDIGEKGHALFNAGRYVQAIKALKQALDESASPQKSTYYAIGKSYLRLSQWAVAADYFKQARLIDPAYASAYFHEGECYSFLGRSDEAINSYSHALALEPRNEDALISRAGNWLLSGNYPAAIKDYSKAIFYNPGNALALRGRAFTLSHAGELERSLQDYSQAIQIEQHYPENYARRGAVHMKMGNDSAALVDFNAYLQLKPETNTADRIRQLITKISKRL